MANDSGGFFVNLGLKTDKDSFDKGHKSVEGITNSVSRLVSTVKNAAPVLMAGLAGTFETAELKAAKAIGISTESLDSWKVAAGMAGTNAEALTASMAQLEAKMQALKLGQVDQGLATNLGFLGIGYSQFADMDATERMDAVFKAASAMQDQQKAALLVGNILGSAGQDYYRYLQLSGSTLKEELAIGRSLTFTSEESKRKAMAFNHELQGIYAAGKSISMLFGSEVAAALTPTVRRIREWIGANNEAISSGITEFVGKLGTVLNKVVDTLVKGYPIVKGLIDKAGGLEKVIVRIGIGLGSLKILQFTAGLTGIANSVGALKLALGAGLFVAAGSILDPEFMDNITPKLKESFNKVRTEAFEPLKNSLGELIKTLTNSDSISEGLEKITTGLLDFATNGIVAAANSINAFANQWVGFVSLIKGDDEGLNKALERERLSWLAVGDAITGGKASESAAYHDERAKVLADMKSIESMKGSPYYPALKEQFNKSEAAEKYNLKINDGIIKPNGGVVSVAPDDWVFAVRDVANLASAFAPQAAGISNVNAPASYVINQTFNINGSRDIPQTIKAQAYKGTQEGLSQIMEQTARRAQLMPSAY